MSDPFELLDLDLVMITCDSLIILGSLSFWMSLGIHVDDNLLDEVDGFSRRPTRGSSRGVCVRVGLLVN